MNGTASVTLQAGEYQVYTNKNISSAVITDVINVNLPELNMRTSIYPNPAKTSANLEYQLPESGNVQIHAYNMNGEDCGLLFSGYQFKGTQKIIIQKNQSMQMPGLYFISIIQNQKQKINKLLITN